MTWRMRASSAITSTGRSAPSATGQSAIDGLGGVDGVGSRQHELDPVEIERAGLVEAGQQEEIGDQVAHAPGLPPDARQDPGEVLGTLVGTSLEELGVGRDGRERSAQLVGGVGEEPAHRGLRLAEVRLGAVPGGKGLLDPGKHRVEDPREPAHLGRGMLLWHPPAELAPGDVFGGALDFDQRVKAEVHEPPSDDDREQQGGGGHEQLDLDKARQGGVGRRSKEGRGSADGRRREATPVCDKPALTG